MQLSPKDQSEVIVKAWVYKALMSIASRYFNELDCKFKRSIIHLPQNLNLETVFRGLERGFHVHFRTAQCIQTLFTYSNVYIGWNSCEDNLFTEEQLMTQAKNLDYLSRCVKKLLPSNQIARNIYLDVSLRLVEECRKELLGIEAEAILRGWQKRLTGSEQHHKRKYFDQVIKCCSWSKKRENFIGKYGERIAIELVSEEIATGKVYQGVVPDKCKVEDIIKYLLDAGKTIIKRDKQLQEEFEMQNY